MNCAQARKILYPAPQCCGLSLETAPALEHLRQCEVCRFFFESQAAWSALLREKLGAETSPQTLRKHIAALIERQQALTWTRTVLVPWQGLAVAASITILLLITVWLADYRPSERFFQELCEDHLKYLNADSQIRSSETQKIESWFQDRAGFKVRVPVMESAELIGGRLCFLQGKKAALVFYRKEGSPLSLFQFSQEGVSLRALDRWELEAAPIWRKSWKGYSLVAFEDRGIVTALISDLRESELLDLAIGVRTRARGY